MSPCYDTIRKKEEVGYLTAYELVLIESSRPSFGEYRLTAISARNIDIHKMHFEVQIPVFLPNLSL